MLNDVIKELTTERLVVGASLGTIRNNGKNVPAIEVKIGNNETKRIHTMIYRDLPSNFRRWLKIKLDQISQKDPIPLILPDNRNSL